MNGTSDAVNRWFIASVFTGLLAAGAAQALPDKFAGSWLLFLSVNGKEIGPNEITVGMKITKKEEYYVVEIEVPDVPMEEGKSGDFWKDFEQKWQAETAVLMLALIKQKCSGNYLLDDDKKALTHLNGSVRIQSRNEGRMLCVTDLGCFRRGDQSRLIERYLEQLEAEARKPKIAVDRNITVRSGQPATITFDLARRSRVGVNVTVNGESDRVITGAKRYRVSLVDQAGYQEWTKTKDVSGGHCGQLLARQLEAMQEPGCVVKPGRYHLIFYEPPPSGFSIRVSTSGGNETSARVQVVTQVADAAASRPNTGALLAEAKKLYTDQDYDAAADRSQRVLAAESNNWRAWGILGNCHYKKGRREDALAAYAKSLEANPDQPQLRSWVEKVQAEGAPAAPEK